MEDTGSRILPLKLKNTTITMYDQLIEALKKEGKTTNRPKLFQEWVEESWIKHCGEYMIDLPDHTIYFLNQYDADQMCNMLRQYREKGMTIDDQLVQYICERGPAYSVKKQI